MKYKKKSEEIDAYQITDEDYYTNVNWPNWLFQLEKDGKLILDDNVKRFSVYHKGDTWIANVNDYVVFDGVNYFTLGKLTFENFYERT